MGEEGKEGVEQVDQGRGPFMGDLEVEAMMINQEKIEGTKEMTEEVIKPVVIWIEIMVRRVVV